MFLLGGLTDIQRLRAEQLGLKRDMFSLCLKLIHAVVSKIKV